MTAQDFDDRAGDIRRAAARLFAERSYVAVSMADIGAASGMSASALYRFYSGKADILAALWIQAISDAMASAEAATRGVDDPRTRLLSILRTHAAMSVSDYQDAMRVARRGIDNLPESARGALDEKQRTYLAMWAAPLRVLLPASSEAEIEVRVAAALALMVSIESSKPELHPEALVDQLVSMAFAGMLAEPRPAGALPAQAAPSASPAADLADSRSTKIIAAAQRLFAERGYTSVGMADIGAACDLSAGALYLFFDGKADLLATMCRGFMQRIRGRVEGATENVDDPGVRLDARMRAHAGLVVIEADMVAIVRKDLNKLPAEEQTKVWGEVTEMMDDWVDDLQALRPELVRDQVKAAAYGALAILQSSVPGIWPQSAPELVDLLVCAAYASQLATLTPGAAR